LVRGGCKQADRSEGDCDVSQIESWPMCSLPMEIEEIDYSPSQQAVNRVTQRAPQDQAITNAFPFRDSLTQQADQPERDSQRKRGKTEARPATSTSQQAESGTVVLQMDEIEEGGYGNLIAITEKEQDDSLCDLIAK